MAKRYYALTRLTPDAPWMIVGAGADRELVVRQAHAAIDGAIGADGARLRANLIVRDYPPIRDAAGAIDWEGALAEAEKRVLMAAHEPLVEAGALLALNALGNVLRDG